MKKLLVVVMAVAAVACMLVPPAFAGLGDSSADLLFTPVAPCRIVDTRVAGGRIDAGTQRNFYVVGAAANFASQGGTAGGCGIPAGATAVMINYVAVGPAGPGDLRAWPYGSTMPNSSVINYAAYAGLNLANGLVQPICDSTATTCTSDLTVQADVSSTHLVADVMGYYQKYPGVNVAGGLAADARLKVVTGDIVSTAQGNGLIMKASDGANCFRITVNNAGALSTSSVTCP
ncbi:MAG: hypothetical protein M0Z71_07940 [Nitrospiraceae bacterium]|nr:hypothetical protein [Nitrospiraceae bacterium]